MGGAAESKIPDVSLELDRVLNYADFLREDVWQMGPQSNGYIWLTKNQVETYSWMLTDIGNFLHNLGETLYPSAAIPSPAAFMAGGDTEVPHKAEREKKLVPHEDSTNHVSMVDLENVTDKLAVLCSALAHEADKVGTLAETPLNHSDAQGLMNLALEAHVTLHKQVYGMTPAEMARRGRQ